MALGSLSCRVSGACRFWVFGFRVAFALGQGALGWVRVLGAPANRELMGGPSLLANGVGGTLNWAAGSKKIKKGQKNHAAQDQKTNEKGSKRK